MSRGWFILELYTAEGVAQTTDVNIELSDHIRIDVNNADHCDASIDDDHKNIDDDHKNIDISISSVYSESIEVSRTVHLDIGKVEPFGGDG